jgi:hypothetical protein
MARFTFYIHDRRYHVPDSATVEANSVGDAKAVAIEWMLQSPTHTAIDVCEDDHLKFSVTVPRSAHIPDDGTGSARAH